MLHARLGADFVSLDELLACASVFRFLRLSDYRVAAVLCLPRVVAEADSLRQFSERFFEEFDMRYVIEIDDIALFECVLVLGSRSLVRSEHNEVSFQTDHFRKHKFRKRRTVSTASLFRKDFQNVRIRASFHRKIFPEFRKNRK